MTQPSSEQRCGAWMDGWADTEGPCNEPIRLRSGMCEFELPSGQECGGLPEEHGEGFMEWDHACTPPAFQHIRIVEGAPCAARSVYTLEQCELAQEEHDGDMSCDGYVPTWEAYDPGHEAEKET